MRRLLFIPLFAALTALGDTNLTAWVQVENGKAVLIIQASNAVGNFRIVGTTVTATNPATAAASSSELVTGQTLGTLRNDFTGYAGCYLTNTSASAVNVTHLGRWVVSGNDDLHNVLLRSIPSMTVVADVIFSTAGATAGGYYYAATNFTLSAGGVYVLVSNEVNGQDQFYDSDTSITVESSRGIAAGPACYAAYWNDTPTPIGTAGYSFGPVNMKFAP